MKFSTVSNLGHKAARLYPLSAPNKTVSEMITEFEYISKQSKTKTEAAKMIYELFDESHNDLSENEITLEIFKNDLLNQKKKKYYAVKSIGIDANDGSRFCPQWFRFETKSERDNWVNQYSDRSVVKSSDPELRAVINSENMDWSLDDSGFEYKFL